MKEITYDEQAWKKIQEGVNKLANIVKTTLGPGGTTVILEKAMGQQHITRDGVTVAREIILEDPVENIGCSIVKEAAEKTVQHGGDGTTTSTVLAQAIFNAGYKNVSAGAKRADIKNGIDLAVKHVVEVLKNLSKTVEGEDILKIATVSANGDVETAKLINEAITQVGKDGIVTVEDTKGVDSFTKKVEGMRFERGYLSPYFVTNQEKMECEFRNCQVLIYDGRIENFRELIPLLDKVRKTQDGGQYPLLIIAEDVVGNALGTLAMNHIQQRMSVCAVQSPDHGDSRKEQLKDFAALTGATIIAKELGLTLNTAKPEVLGMADKVRVSQWNTTIIDGHGKPEDIMGRIEVIKEQMNDANEHALVKLKERYARLVSGLAVIYVGGTTDIEIKEKKDRIDDALQATKAALEEGVVPGGGVAYVRAYEALKGRSGLTGDKLTGYNSLLECLTVPFKTIVENTGANGDVVYSNIAGKQETYGYDSRSGEYTDMVASGIIDPTKVSRLAIENAASVAGMLLSTRAVVNIKR